MRIMVVGDTHGDASAVEYKAKIAKSLGVTHMLIVGDFGLWVGFEGVKFLDDVNEIARRYNIHIFALPGNHENHDLWEQLVNIGLPTSSGFTYVRDRLLLAPKVHNWKWGKKRFFICGGAVSIDKQRRVEGKSWWKNETFSEADLASVVKYQGPPVDFLFTHDCSDHTPWHERLKPDFESQLNRQRIDMAIKALRPKYHFHGHMHTKYEWLNTKTHGLRDTAFGVDESEWNGHTTKTYGLECNHDKNSWLILDTGSDNKKKPDEEPQVYWPGEAFAVLGD